MATILRKTPKGTDEITTRANRLAPRLRSALILADGVRDVVELSKLIAQNPVETLQALIDQGFIEVVAIVEAPPRAVKPVAATGAANEAEKKAFNTFRTEAVRAFNDLVGPSGEALAIKMEKAATREQLAPLLRLAIQVIGNSRGGARAAADYEAHFAGH